MMFSRLAADALLHFAALGRSKHTVASYDAAFRQFQSFLDARGLADDTRHFTDERVMQFMDWLHAHGAGPNTKRTRLSALASLAKFGARMKHRGKPVISVNPLLGLERPKKRRPREKFLFPVEMRGFASRGQFSATEPTFIGLQSYSNYSFPTAFRNIRVTVL